MHTNIIWRIGVLSIELKKHLTDRANLYLAARSGRLHIFELLLKAGADIEAQDFKGASPLHVATWHGHKDLVQFLVNNEANIELKDSIGETPLHVAALTGDEDIATLLVNKGTGVSQLGIRQQA